MRRQLKTACYRRALSLSVLVFSTMGVAAESRVQDPRYGVALWYYFQGQNLEALSELMKAEAQKPIAAQGESPALMRAGLELAYGMADRAEDSFHQLLNESTSPRTKVTAWYYLAELYYQQKNFLSADNALQEAKLIEGVSTAMQGQINLLQANIFIARNELSRVEELLAVMDEFNGSSALVLFNLGNAHVREGDLELGQSYFDKALQSIAVDEQISESDLALRDKINTAAGFAALLQKAPLEAINYFKNVQQGGLNTELAMLGYGRAAAELDLYEQSLGYLGQLSQSQTRQSAVFESWLALPVTYERLDRPNTALNAYQASIRSYDDELVELDAITQKILDQDLGLLNLSQESTHWLKSAQQPVGEPSEPYFSELFSESGFQTRLRELQDLLNLGELRVDRLERLDMLEESLLLREQNRIDHKQEFADLQSENRLEALEQGLSKRQKEFDKAVADKDYLALMAGTEEEALYQRVQVAKQRLVNLQSNGESLEKEQYLLGLYEGLTLWQAAQDFSANAYAKEISLKQAKAELNTFASNQSRIATLLEQEIENSDHQQKLELARANAEQIELTLDSKIAEVRSGIFAELFAEVEARKRELSAYRTEARLASLRIYEQSSLTALNQPLLNSPVKELEEAVQ